MADPATEPTGRQDPESIRLGEVARRERDWKRWGAYLAEREWGTVREDDSADGSSWTSFPYDQARARAYRWGEDGLLGFTDRECRLCFAPSLWNGRDDHLKERLFGLTNPEGNHGEDVKEVYYYLDGTPTHSYLKALYKYPQAEFPYDRLRAENRRRGRDAPEFELIDAGAFDEGRYWDLTVEYAKAGPDDVLIRLTVANRGPDVATIHVLPTLWFRNTWTWGVGCEESGWGEPGLARAAGEAVRAEHSTLGAYLFRAERPADRWAFTANETDPHARESGAVAAVAGALGRLVAGAGGPYKDAFHRLVVDGEAGAARDDAGTKAAAIYALEVGPGSEVALRFRLTAEGEAAPEPFADFEATFAARVAEADAFYDAVIPPGATPAERRVSREAYAGLVWSQQFTMYIVHDWIEGDAARPVSPEVRARRINQDWRHLYVRDVLSVPDKWEYPGLYAWDLAFHMVPLARIDPDFAKAQLVLLLREWYMHPSGQIPAFEQDLSNVNPPIHAWACWQVFERSGRDDHAFLARCFHKLLLNFTWWVNRKDPEGRGVFGGGFLGMDNIGVFDRSQPLPDGMQLRQADGTAWMGFFCTTMLQIALELARHSAEYEDVTSKFFEHYLFIAEAINHLGGDGLWDEADGFYYDQLRTAAGGTTPIKLRAMVGLVPLLGVLTLKEEDTGALLPGFHDRLTWFLANRQGWMPRVADLERRGDEPRRRMLLSLPGRARLERALRHLMDPAQFLAPFGVRSLSRTYRDEPFHLRAHGRSFTVRYVPADMDSADFGGNSNWRGPIWMPINVLLIDALREYHRYHGDDLRVEDPTGSGRRINLDQAADDLARRLIGLFVAEGDAVPPSQAGYGRQLADPAWRAGTLFFEYFDGDTGRGLGASHQTGWSALVATLIEDVARRRAGAAGQGSSTLV